MKANFSFAGGSLATLFCTLELFRSEGAAATSNPRPSGQFEDRGFPADVVSTSAPPAQLRVVVLPFQNVGADADLDNWCYALPGWLRSCLDMAEFTEVVGGETTQKTVKRVRTQAKKVEDSELARRVAGELEAGVAVWGEFRRSTNEWTARTSVLRLDTEAAPVDIKISAPGWVALSESLALRIASVLERKIPDDDRQRWKRRMAHSEPAQRDLACAMAMKILEAPSVELQKVLRQVLAEDPECAMARGMLFPLLTQPEEFEEAVREALRQTPDDCNAHVAAASICLSKEDPAGAKRELEEAVRLHRGCPTAAQAMFLMHAQRGRWQELATMLTPVYQARPDETDLAILLASARAQCGDSDAAWDLLTGVNDLPEEDQVIDLALLAAAATGGRWDLAGRELTRLGPQAAKSEFVRESLASIGMRYPPESSSNAPIVKPRIYTSAGLSAELERRLSAEERTLMVNPLEVSPEIAAEARRLTVGLTNAAAEALALFGEVARRGRGHGDGGARTASESLIASSQAETRLSCQEHAKLFVALARTLGLEAWMVHVVRAADGLPCYHDCAALFLEGHGLLVDPTWRAFGISHQVFAVLDDVQAVAHHAMQPTKGLPDPRRLRAGLKLNPDDLWTQLQFVRGMARAGEYAPAEDELRKARSTAPEAWDIQEAAAELEIAREHWSSALTELRRALALNPSDALLHVQLSRAYEAQGDFAKSTEHMERALELNRGEISREFSRAVSSQFSAVKAFTRSQAGDSSAREELRRLAEGGDVTAQKALARAYYEERPPAIEQAMHWNLKAAEQGDAQAQLDYANNLLVVRGLEAGKEAVIWLRRAAEQGHAEAQYRLGLALYEGKIAPRDNVTAGQWVVLAAEAGHKEAKRLLREMELFLGADEMDAARKRARNFNPAQH